MYQRLVFTLTTAAALIGLSVLYSLAMRPVIVVPTHKTPAVEQKSFTEAKRPAENVRVAKRYIPWQAWATESKYMLRAEQAFVYTQSWERDQNSEKRVKFRPFAMVWVSVDKDGTESAFSIDSEWGQLEFAAAFDEKNPNPGRVVGAVLSGKVQIAGPDGLKVVGQDFIFNEEALSLDTTNPVKFAYQSNSGTATQMRMKLIPAEGPPGVDRPHIYGVESIRLLGGQEDIRLRFQLPQGDQPRPVEVRCAGDLEYTVSTNTAVLTTDVRVWTGVRSAFDGLNCDMLTLQFVPKKTSEADPPAPTEPPPDTITSVTSDRRAESYQKFERDLEFSWLEAVSRVDERRRVKVHSHSYGFEASMARLTYDAQSEMLSMSCEGGEPVTIDRNGSKLVAPEIEAQLRLGTSNPLETLVCRGQGKLSYADEKTGRLAFVAEWKKHLSKRTDEETKLDLIELDEQASFREPGSSGLVADLIKIWLEPLAFNLPQTPGEKPVDAPTPEPEPRRLLAIGGVAFKSPQLMIQQTNELDIRIDETESVPAVSQRTRSQLLPTSRTATSSRPLRYARSNGFASIPAVPDGSLGPAVDIPENDVPDLITVVANQIAVRLARVSGRESPHVKEVHADGRVTITQERKQSEHPMRLEGDRVDVTAEVEKQEIVHVHGTPAFIRDQGFEIEGKDIHLDRGANRAWVTGAGKLDLPIPADTKIPGVEGPGPKKLTVHWNESMEFNGLVATFLGQVEAKLGYGTMRCEQMIVELVNQMSFQLASPETKPQLHTVNCLEHVRFENATHVNKTPVDVYRGHVGEFKVNYTTGDVTAQGPGEIHAWQRRTRSAPIIKDTIQANRPIPVEVAVWDFTGIRFEGRLKGRFDGQSSPQATRQRATVDDRVEVIHGPVKHFGEKVDPDHLPSRAGTIRCDKLEFVNHPATEKNPVEYRELVGLGNAEIEGQVDGRFFTASSDEVSYDGSKGIYILRAHGRQNARLTGVGYASQIGQRIEFNPDPKIKSLIVSNAVEGQGGR